MLRDFRSYLARFAAGEYCMSRGVKAPESLLPVIRAEQINAVTRLTPAMMAGNISNALIGLFATLGSPYWLASVIWAMATAGYAALILLRNRKNIAKGPRTTASRNGIQSIVASSLVMGALWACLPLLLLLQGGPASAFLIIAFPAGMVCIGAFSLASIPSAAIAFGALPVISGMIAVSFAGGANMPLIMMLGGALCVTLLAAVCAHHDQLFQRVIDHATAEEQARRDALTGLHNRKGFEDFLQSSALEPMKRHGSGFTLMFLDLDSFKLVNDTHGHAAGDELLCRIAERLQTATRPEDCVARLGGDEFAILCRDVVSARRAGMIAERILRSLNTPVAIDGRPVTCRVSIGIALAPQDGDDFTSLFKNADLALYFAKRNKPGDYAFFQTEVDEREQKRKHLAQALRGALEKGQFQLDFQPIYATGDERLAGFEALLRWRHPEYGRIQPSEFIPLAEELGLIQDIGEWIIDTACKALLDWPDHVRVSVNFSPVQLNSPTLVQYTMDTLGRYNIPPRRFEIEVTESISMDGDQKSLDVLEDMRDNGIIIALDDFGTGYSSMSYICQLPVSRVKIDRSFVSTCFQSTESMAVIQAIIGLAHSLNMQVVAEGIETSAQYHMLAGMGCEEIQGYLLGRPMSRKDAAAMANDSGPLIKLVA